MLYFSLGLLVTFFIILKQNKPKPELINLYTLPKVLEQDKEFSNNFVDINNNDDTLWFFDDIDQEDEPEFKLIFLPVTDELVSGIVTQNYISNKPITNTLNSIFDEDKFLDDIGDFEIDN